MMDTSDYVALVDALREHSVDPALVAEVLSEHFAEVASGIKDPVFSEAFWYVSRVFDELPSNWSPPARLGAESILRKVESDRQAIKTGNRYAVLRALHELHIYWLYRFVPTADYLTLRDTAHRRLSEMPPEEKVDVCPT